MKVFEAAGKQNTEETVAIAAKKAAELNCDMVVSSNTGYSAEALYEACKKAGAKGKIVLVSQVTTAKNEGVNVMSAARKAELEAKGIVVVRAAHTLSGVERSFSTRFGGIYPTEVMAYTLRTFGQGTKVCFECSVMALDADAIEFGKRVVAVGGTGGGADTAMVITPSYSNLVFETKMHEHLCKPDMFKA